MIRSRLSTTTDVGRVVGRGVGVVRVACMRRSLRQSGSSITFFVEGLCGLAKSMETVEGEGDVAQGEAREFDRAFPHKGDKVARAFPSTVKAVVGEEASDGLADVGGARAATDPHTTPHLRDVLDGPDRSGLVLEVELDELLVFRLGSFFGQKLHEFVGVGAASWPIRDGVVVAIHLERKNNRLFLL